MTTNAQDRDRTPHARAMRVAGIVTILLSVGAAFLPAGKTIAPDVIGGLLIAAGLIELVAGSLRREIRPYSMAAGGVTAVAGVLFLVDPETHFFPMVWPIVGWLILRGVILGAASTQAHGSVRTWTGLSAGMDLCLAALLIAGLSIATIVVSVFGPTRPLIASFAWILAASFVVNGLLMLDVASCEDESASGL